MSRAPVWYTDYSSRSERVLELQAKFHKRCQSLGEDTHVVLKEVKTDILARTVLESNWQEGLQLGMGRTMELAHDALGELESISGPHLDMTVLLKYHRNKVAHMKKDKASVEEVGAYNLAAAHGVFSLIINELVTRYVAWLELSLDQPSVRNLEDKRNAALKRAVDYPVTGEIRTYVDYVDTLKTDAASEIQYPMKPDYIHFLHRLALMGILKGNQLGQFRKTAVHIGRPDTMFPPPSLVTSLMDEFCREFPSCVLRPLTAPRVYDHILKAAEVSFNFVRIHPYADGNGRVSRLLMNLVLSVGHHPPVYIKADKKGRHRYNQALRRAERGRIEPLACLIATSLEEIYERLLRAISKS